MKNSFYINTDNLEEGLFIDLELGWSEHPFLFSKFKLNKTSDIDKIKRLGLKKVKVIISRSPTKVLKKVASKKLDPASLTINISQDKDEQKIIDQELSELWDQKKAGLDKAEEFRKQRVKAASQYRETQKRVNNLVRDFKIAPANAIRDTAVVIDDLMALLESEKNVVVSLINLTEAEFSQSTHAINVTVLALSLAKSMNLPKEEIQELGTAAILHDIGKLLLPIYVTQSSKLSAADEEIMKTHVDKGVSLLKHFKHISSNVIEIVANHHVYLDGTGYPETPNEGEISTLCHILQVANHYDAMCNPPDESLALSPKVAMANLFSNYDGKLNYDYVHLFVRHFGVYPPGTLVLLSDDSIALVSSVDSNNLLTPTIIIYNPDIPARQALMMSLTDHPDLKILRVLKASECPATVLDYLGFEARIGFFFGSGF